MDEATTHAARCMRRTLTTPRYLFKRPLPRAGKRRAVPFDRAEGMQPPLRRRRSRRISSSSGRSIRWSRYWCCKATRPPRKWPGPLLLRPLSPQWCNECLPLSLRREGRGEGVRDFRSIFETQKPPHPNPLPEGEGTIADPTCP